MSTPTEDVKAHRAAKEAAARLMGYERQLRARYEELGFEEATLTITKSRDEVVHAMEGLVDVAGQRWARSMVGSVTGYVEGRGFVYEPALPRTAGELDFDLLCGVLPSEMKRRLTHAIDQSGIPFGASEDSRVARLAEIRSERELIERQHTELVDESGIPGLALLEVVQQRRDATAQQVRREELLAEERARLGVTVPYEVR